MSFTGISAAVEKREFIVQHAREVLMKQSHVGVGRKEYCLFRRQIIELQKNIAHALQKLTTTQKATSEAIY